MVSSRIDRRTIATVVLVFVLAFAVIVSAAHAVPPADRGQPASGPAVGSQSQTNPARQCKAERASIGATAFAEKYGANANRRNAFGKCVSGKAKAKKPEPKPKKATAKEKPGKR